MIETFFAWLVKLILGMLAQRAANEAAKAAERIAKEKERGEVNDDNVKKYDAALDRTEQIRRATDLLNGTRSDR